MYESLLKRVTSEEIMSLKVKRSSSPGLPGENLFNCLPKCLCGRTPAPSSRVQAKADVDLKKKMVTVQANLHPTFYSIQTHRKSLPAETAVK